MVQQRIQAILEEVLREMGLQPPPRLQIDVPRDRRHGDLSTNVALLLARETGEPPVQLARRIADRLAARPDLHAEVSIAGPGFVNLHLRAGGRAAALRALLAQGIAVGRTDAAAGTRAQLEFVSANPTGPLNVVSARGAAFGSTLAAMLRMTGADVQCEFYVNDSGRQVELLGESVRARFAATLGRSLPFPEDGYHGDYVHDIATAAPPGASQWLDLPAAESAAAFGRFAVERVLAGQQADLEQFGVRYDRWFRETELHQRGEVEATRRLLEASGHTYVHEGALFFRSTTWGDDKDRVLVRSDGTPTYFLADAAYHRDKHERGFRHVVDVWGPDHHGHIARMQALARALGYPEDWLEVVIVQWV
jgi:arginyl-tRNA synthetase